MNWIFKYVRDLADIRTTDFVYVDSKDRLPPASEGVIELEPDTTYFFTTTVDLTGDRLVCQQNTTILGGSSESSRIISTGLSGALISSAWTLPMRGITITADIALNLDASLNPGQALDWFGVNLTDCENVGLIKGYNNTIFTDCALLNSANLSLEGAVGTIGFSQCIFSGRAGERTLIVPATTIINRRFRVIYSAFVTPSGGTGIDFATGASVPAESYILDTVNFGGAGTPTEGVQYTDNKALFLNCVGQQNSASVCALYMDNNATATVISTPGTFVKTAGTTTGSSLNQKFSVSNNRATYTGAITSRFTVQVVASMASGNNQSLRARIAKNGTTLAESQSRFDTTGLGKASAIFCQCVVELSTGDYVEYWVTNDTAANNVTVGDMSMVVSRSY